MPNRLGAPDDGACSININIMRFAAAAAIADVAAAIYLLFAAINMYI